MRRIFVSVLLAAAFAWTAAVSGCSGDGAGSGDASADSYGVHVGGDDGPGGDGQQDDSSPMPQTTVRLAHASPDLGPVDFCWRTSGTATFTGPVLSGEQPLPEAGPPPGDAGVEGPSNAGDADASEAGSDAADGGDARTDADGSTADAATPDATLAEGGAADAGTPDGGTPGQLVFGTMTPDVLLPATGTVDIAVVAAGQTSCAVRRLVGTVTLGAGKRATVVLMGLAGQDSGPDALTVIGFTDTPTDPQSALVRVIHAALGFGGAPPTPALSVQTGGTLIAAEVDPKMAATASTTPAVDGLGYATLQPLAPPSSLQLATVGDAASAHWTTAARDLSVRMGTAHTGIVVSLGQGSLGIVWCSGDSTTAGVAASCVLLPAGP